MTQEHTSHPAKHHRWITSFSGKRINSLAVKESDIYLPDMVRGLAMQTRYMGQIRDFYSIAEHSVLVSRLAEIDGHPTHVLRAAQLHDGHEYITGDFPSPFKYDVVGLREWERNVEAVFRSALGLPPNDDPMWDIIKRYDLLALHFEASRLMDCEPGWIDPDMVREVERTGLLSIKCYDWRTAASAFKQRANQLGFGGF